MSRGRLFPKQMPLYPRLFVSGLGLVAVANVRVRGTVCRFASAPGTDFRVNFPNHELWRSLEKPPLVLEFYTTANWFPVAFLKRLQTKRPASICYRVTNKIYEDFWFPIFILITEKKKKKHFKGTDSGCFTYWSSFGSETPCLYLFTFSNV